MLLNNGARCPFDVVPSLIVDAPLTCPTKNAHFRDGWDHLMKFDITSFQDVAANLPVGGKTCDLAHTKVSTQTETDAEIASLIQQVGATSVTEIDRLIAELQEVKNHLQSEGEQVEREMVRYTKLTQMASFTAKIIFDAISQWHPATNQQKTNASEITAASTNNYHHSQWDTSELGQAADATKGT
jgi:hypothetical protein